MPRKVRQLKASLHRAGAYQVSLEGSHAKWRHPLVSVSIVLSGHDSDDAKPYQEKAVHIWLQQIAKAKEKEA